MNRIECFLTSFMRFFLVCLQIEKKNFFKRLKVGKIKYTFLRVREDVKITYTFCNFFRVHNFLFLFNFLFIY